MGALPDPAASLLGADAHRLVGAIFDPDLKERVIRVIQSCALALAAIDAIKLDDYELIDLDLPDLSVWNDASPRVRDALVGVGGALQTIVTEFPAPVAAPDREIDVDGAFDALEADFDAPPHVRTGDVIDRLLAQHQREPSVDATIGALSAMLRTELGKFAGKIRNPQVLSSRWQLLGELQEFQATTSQCLEAVVVAVLAPLRLLVDGVSGGSAELLPRYKTELEHSLALRDEIDRLSSDVSRLHGALVQDPSRADALHAALASRLEAFGQTASYRKLWARDKREIIEARVQLRAWQPGRDPVAVVIRRADGLARFLELLSAAIRRRPELEAYDRDHPLRIDALG